MVNVPSNPCPKAVEGIRQKIVMDGVLCVLALNKVVIREDSRTRNWVMATPPHSFPAEVGD